MERRRYIFRLFIAVALGCTVAGAELVKDGDFSGTTTDPEPAFSSYWDTTQSGPDSVLPNPTGPDFEAFFAEDVGGAQILSLSQDELGLAAGVTYVVSFDLSIGVEIIAGESDYFQVFLGQNSVPVYRWTNDASDPDFDGTVWQETVVRQATAGTPIPGLNDLLEFRCTFDGDAGAGELTRIMVDNVSVSVVPVPPSVVMAGLGMMSYVVCGGTIGRRIRRRRRAEDQSARQ